MYAKEKSGLKAKHAAEKLEAEIKHNTEKAELRKLLAEAEAGKAGLTKQLADKVNELECQRQKFEVDMGKEPNRVRNECFAKITEKEKVHRDELDRLNAAFENLHHSVG